MTTTTLTTVEQAILNHAVEDWAGQYIGGPFSLTNADAIRYVTEGHLCDLCARHGFAVVCAAVEEYITAHPEVLQQRFTRDQITQRERDRVRRADELLAEAGRAYKTADKARALKLIDEAELVAPRHRPLRGSYDWYRNRVR